MPYSSNSWEFNFWFYKYIELMNLPIRILLYIPSNKHDFHDLRIERLTMVRDSFYTRSTHLVYNRDCVCPRLFHLSSSTPQDIDHYISSTVCF